MTQWVEDRTGGRERGPRALARAWVEVIVRPWRFFRTGVGAGDQAPGLVFAIVIVFLEEASRVGVVELARRGLVDIGRVQYPILVDLAGLESILFLLVVALLVAPLFLHLLAALQTVLLRAFAPERGGVSETVQVLAYATAPCVFAGLPSLELRVVLAAWGIGVYVLGVHVVHSVSVPKAVAIGGVPAILVFGYGFRGIDAARVLLGL